MNVNPFSTTVKYSLDPSKNTVTLTPTLGTLARAFGPVLVTTAGLFLYGTYLNWKESRDEAKNFGDEIKDTIKDHVAND